MAPNLFWVLLGERFFLPKSVSYLCCSRGLLPFFLIWICPWRSFLHFANREKSLEKCFYLSSALNELHWKTVGSCGKPRNVSSVPMNVLERNKCKLWKTVHCNTQYLSIPCGNYSLNLLSSSQATVGSSVWYVSSCPCWSVGYKLGLVMLSSFHVTVLSQRWKHSFCITLHWLSVYFMWKRRTRKDSVPEV